MQRLATICPGGYKKDFYIGGKLKNHLLRMIPPSAPATQRAATSPVGLWSQHKAGFGPAASSLALLDQHSQSLYVAQATMLPMQTSWADIKCIFIPSPLKHG